MTESRVREVLACLAQIGLDNPSESPGYKSPVSHLVRLGVLGLLPPMVEQVASGRSVEFRLNGAGLKLYVSARPSRWTVGGDQRGRYAAFCEAANTFLRERGLRGSKG